MTMTREQFNEVMPELLAGKTKPINQAAAYALKRYRESRAEFDAVSKAHDQLRAQVEAAKQKALDLQGRCNAYAEDLEHFYGVEDGKGESDDNGREHGGPWRERFGDGGDGERSGEPDA
jgi:hypothetical protein